VTSTTNGCSWRSRPARNRRPQRVADADRRRQSARAHRAPSRPWSQPGDAELPGGPGADQAIPILSVSRAGRAPAA
jgi:hypothetical protein